MIEVSRTDGEISINRNRNKGLWVRGNRKRAQAGGD